LLLNKICNTPKCFHNKGLENVAKKTTSHKGATFWDAVEGHFRHVS